MVSAAKLQIADSEFDYAMTHLNTALSIDENEVDARLLRAKLLLVRQEYANARTELERVLKSQRDHSQAKDLLEHSKKVRANDTDTLHALAEEFARQKAYTLAASVRRQEKEESDARDKKLTRYRSLIEISWPGLGQKLNYDHAGTLILDAPVSDPAPLCDIPVNSLTLAGYKEVDLTSLKGLPLTRLTISGCPNLRDLTALQGLLLITLTIDNCPRISDLWPVRGLPLEALVIHNCDSVIDLRPLEGMKLRALTVARVGGPTRVRDLRPLKGMPLTTLNLCWCQISDLTPLKGMPLTALNLYSTSVTDLTALAGNEADRPGPLLLWRLRRSNATERDAPDEDRHHRMQYHQRHGGASRDGDTSGN